MLGSRLSIGLGSSFKTSPYRGWSGSISSILSYRPFILLKSITGILLYILLGSNKSLSPYAGSSPGKTSSYKCGRPIIFLKSILGWWSSKSFGSRIRLSPSTSPYGFVIGSFSVFSACLDISNPYKWGSNCVNFTLYSPISGTGYLDFKYSLKA